MQGFGIIMQPPIQEIRDNPAKYFRGKTKNFLNIINYIMMLQEKHEHVFVSQITLAEHLGVRRETINRNIKRMVKDGVLKKIPQGVKKTCIYKLNPYFSCVDIMVIIRTFFKSLRYLPLLLLTPFAFGASRPFSRDVTLFNSQGYKDISINNKQRVTSMTKQKLKLITSLKSLKGVEREDLIKLFAFPDEALLFTDDKVLMARNIRKPFNLFMSILLDWMLWHDQEPNWSLVNDLKKQFGSSLDGLFVESLEPTKSPIRPKQPIIVNNPAVKQPRAIACAPKWTPPLRIQVDTEQENRARQEARNTKEWQECERILGIKINPPIPEFVVKRR